MSKLDEIYFDIHYASPPHDKLFMLNIGNDLVYQAFKNELKGLLVELIGQDDRLTGGTEAGNDDNPEDDEAYIRNELRAELRKKVEEL